MNKSSTAKAQANNEEEKANVTERLFSDLLPQSDETKETTPPEDEAKNEEEVKKTEVATTLAPVPEYLDVEGFGDKKVKVKIDGVETAIPFKDVIKGYQTDQYLTRKGQRIAEEKKRIGTTPPPPAAEVTTEDYIDPLAAKKIKELQDTIDNYGSILQQELAPVHYERVMVAIDKKMKQEGFDDFKEKLPVIENILQSMTPEDMAFLDNPEGFEKIYKNLKLQDFKMMQENKKPALPPDNRPVPKIVPIESSSSPSGGVNDGKTVEREKDKKRAIETGDWTNFLMKWG